MALKIIIKIFSIDFLMFSALALASVIALTKALIDLLNFYVVTCMSRV